MKNIELFVLFLIFNSVNSFFWGVLRGGITYTVYTRQNMVIGQQLVYGNLYSITNSNFNNAKPTRFVIHGSNQSGRSAFARDIKNAYLTRGDFNVIVVDWSNFIVPYFQFARYNVGGVGIAISKFITFLNPNYTTLHILGYDLGAHIAGFAGKNSIRGRINRIIGLDPSRPLFNVNMSGGRISAGDAQLVEIFHSNGGQLGIFPRIGDIDYYLNNGKTQPECKVITDANCSHYRSVITFSRLLSGQNNYVVIPCNNIAEVATGCSSNPIEILLEEISPSGIYQINTVNAEALNQDVEIIDNTEGSTD